MKKRAIKNKKHRIAKVRRIVRRKGDDWAGMSNKQFRPVRPPEGETAHSKGEVEV